MATGDRHSDPESSNLAPPRCFHRVATLAERQERRVCAMTMGIGGEAWRAAYVERRFSLVGMHFLHPSHTFNAPMPGVVNCKLGGAEPLAAGASAPCMVSRR